MDLHPVHVGVIHEPVGLTAEELSKVIGVHCLHELLGKRSRCKDPTPTHAFMGIRGQIAACLVLRVVSSRYPDLETTGFDSSGCYLFVA